jgi:hypothetical protein
MSVSIAASPNESEIQQIALLPPMGKRAEHAARRFTTVSPTLGTDVQPPRDLTAQKRTR